MQMEACAVRKALEDFVPLRLSGGMLRSGGRLVAYTLGERLNSDTFILSSCMSRRHFPMLRGPIP